MPIQLYTPETRYAVVSLPLEQYQRVLQFIGTVDDFVSLTRDKEEVTLIIAQDTWFALTDHFPQAEVEFNRRLIRFDTVLAFSVVGFIAEISRALAEEGISILSISTYRTDAILVPEARIDEAVHAVKRALVAMNYIYLARQ